MPRSYAEFDGQSGFWRDLCVEHRSYDADDYDRHSRNLHGHSDQYGWLLKHLFDDVGC